MGLTSIHRCCCTRLGSFFMPLLPTAPSYSCAAATGFRKYDSIRDTLIHELAHMVRYAHVAFRTSASGLVLCYTPNSLPLRAH